MRSLAGIGNPQMWVAVSLLFGLFILFAPAAGALAIVLWIGAYALVSGFFCWLWRSDYEGSGGS
jgi:uncharacterized membrane protein HdeD (DUF308 family)